MNRRGAFCYVRVGLLAYSFLAGMNAISVGQVPIVESNQGRELFHRHWKSEQFVDPLISQATSSSEGKGTGDGLGPLHNATSCVDCHRAGGGAGIERNVTMLTIDPSSDFLDNRVEAAEARRAVLEFFPGVITLRTVMGIRGEPSTPDDPAKGLVWSSIVVLVDQPGKQSDFVSAGDSERGLFHKHPWSIGGGGASELKELLEENTTETLSARSDVIGITAVTDEDELYMQPFESLCRNSVEKTRPLIVGDVIRDWVVAKCESSIWLYKEDLSLVPLQELPITAKLLWRYRAVVADLELQ